MLNGRVCVPHHFSFLCCAISMLSYVYLFCFIFFLCLMYPMLPVSLVCLLPVSYVSNVTSVSGLSSSCVLCSYSNRLTLRVPDQGYSTRLTLRVPDQGYSRNASCVLKQLSIHAFISIIDNQISSKKITLRHLLHILKISRSLRYGYLSYVGDLFC